MRENSESRPDPDKLLKSIEKNGGYGKKAKLKIYFGMAAGVGKTHAMLEAALKLLSEGVDVAAAYVETHGRREIELLARDLPFIPRRRMTYRGMTIEEMDLDTVLARRPAVALVDELAHTNAPDSRHPKRYQDVIELLDAGINVYTTLNVQHLESRTETVHDISGVTVQETVPDTIIERADEIELVDISPEDLRIRLAEGKIYPLQRARVAVENFFETGNLTALREMALRITAEKVDHALQDYRKGKSIQEPWKTGERLLVGVGPSPFSESLIRWTRRMAYNLDASWTAVNVETPEALHLQAQERLQRNISLARELGAEIVVTRDQDVTDGILRVARQRNITQIVIGKPGPDSWRDLFYRTPVRRLIRESGNIDLYIIRAERKARGTTGRFLRFFPGVIRWKQYGTAVAVLMGVTAANVLMLPFLGARSVSLILLLSMLVLSLFLERGPVFLYAVLSALVWNFLFLPPPFTFYIDSIEDTIMFFMYFIVAIIAGILISRMRAHERAAIRREEQLNVLYDMTKKFALSRSLDEAVGKLLAFINTDYDATSAVYLAGADGALLDGPCSADSAVLEGKDYETARFSFVSGKTAGRFTDTLPSSPYLFIPLYFRKEHVVGVMGIRFPETAVLTTEQKTQIENMASHLALVIERELFTAETQKLKIHEESEKLYNILLSSISHELRTPLTALKGSISTLMSGETCGDKQSRSNLLAGSETAVDRLIRLVDNLLDMSRIESGKIPLNLDWNDLADIIGTALNRLEENYKSTPVAVDCPDDIPLVRVDYNLIALAIYSLVHNAVVHGGAKVAVRVARSGKGIAITVEDEGPGLPEKDTGRIFEKFYRSGKTNRSGGLGLGLSISRGIVELHGGELTGENRTPSGARFVIRLPAETKEKV